MFSFRLTTKTGDTSRSRRQRQVAVIHFQVKTGEARLGLECLFIAICEATNCQISQKLLPLKLFFLSLGKGLMEGLVRLKVNGTKDEACGEALKMGEGRWY